MQTSPQLSGTSVFVTYLEEIIIEKVKILMKKGRQKN